MAIETLDPLALAIAPPLNETPAERWEREQREAAARRVSEQIDDQIKAEKAALKKKKKPIRVLLLGQSESGKSTTVKNFQLAYAYSSFLEERASWTAVIHLNLVRSVNTVLDVLAKEIAFSQLSIDTATPSSSLSSSTSPSSSQRSRSHSPFRFSPTAAEDSSSSPRTDTETEQDPSEHDDSPPAAWVKPLKPVFLSPPGASSSQYHTDPKLAHGTRLSFTLKKPPKLTYTERHTYLLSRLSPVLRQLQVDLERRLGSATTDPPSISNDNSSVAPWSKFDDLTGSESGNPRRPKEFFITSRSGWRSALNRVRFGGGKNSIGPQRFQEATHLNWPKKRRDTVANFNSDQEVDVDVEPRSLEQIYDHNHGHLPDARSSKEVLSACAEDIKALWLDPTVQVMLTRKKVRLEESPGFFLNDVGRIASREYEPSPDDVVRARLRTMGVQEHKFIFDKGSEVGREWILYDVGGARSSRHAWYPYFDDINAIIFLAPINCFDERLTEDKKVNRLEDSLLLWKAIAGCKILRKVQFILFLNKCDLLQKKLLRGVQVKDYVASYGDRPNEARSVAKYFRQQFKDILVRHSPDQRGFYSYLTSVIDTKATAITVAAVREGIQRNHLKEADIIS